MGTSISCSSFYIIMKAARALLSCLLAVAAAKPQNDLTCSICVDIVTDIDNFITSDTTEQQIVDFVKEICKALGQILPDLEATCNALVEAQLPSIIDGLVEQNLNPQEVCNLIAACP